MEGATSPSLDLTAGAPQQNNRGAVPYAQKFGPDAVLQTVARPLTSPARIRKCAECRHFREKGVLMPSFPIITSLSRDTLRLMKQPKRPDRVPFARTIASSPRQREHGGKWPQASSCRPAFGCAIRDDGRLAKTAAKRLGRSAGQQQFTWSSVGYVAANLRNSRIAGQRPLCNFPLSAPDATCSSASALTSRHATEDWTKILIALQVWLVQEAMTSSPCRGPHLVGQAFGGKVKK